MKKGINNSTTCIYGLLKWVLWLIIIFKFLCLKKNVGTAGFVNNRAPRFDSRHLGRQTRRIWIIKLAC